MNLNSQFHHQSHNSNKNQFFKNSKHKNNDLPNEEESDLITHFRNNNAALPIESLGNINNSISIFIYIQFNFIITNLLISLTIR